MNMDKLGMLKQAILVNTCRPKEKEREKITVDRIIQTSPSQEGDTQLGLILFIGMASKLGFKKSEIMDYLSIEFDEEYNYKLGKFEEMLNSKDHKRFKVKVDLVVNYLFLHGYTGNKRGYVFV